MIDDVLPSPRWVVVPPPGPAAVEALRGALQVPRALAALLIQRGHGTVDDTRRFLRPALTDLSDPYALTGMREAVDALVAAVRAGRMILVHGDYDVDGQCAAALLTRTLRAAGARVQPFTPHRLRDGYDFGPAGLAAAQAAGASLIITCDCGITALDTVRAANAAGIGVIVTDHHLPGPALPPALAVVDPQQRGDTSGATALCGTGVAFKLAQALAPALGLPTAFPLHLLDLVALATVADVVPLAGENRILVKYGLRLLSESRWPGLNALIATSGLGGKALRAGHVGFVLGPRLNAAGRIGDAADGLRLLLTDDPAEALALAHRLDGLNTERQHIDQRILQEALAQIEASVMLDQEAALVLASDGWHAGVIGIAASRVVERYGRPTFLITFEGDVGKASGRSISRFDLHAALHACGDLLERFGGHRMAAGFTIHRTRLDAFRDRFRAAAREVLDPGELGPEQRIDLELQLSEVTSELERLCRYLEPCGPGNAAPVFGVRNVRFSAPVRVGQGHLRGVLDDGVARLPAIGFQWADRVPWLGEMPVDVAFRLELNTWNGQTTLQARLCALSPSRA